nr:hypothetical protein [Nocardiopsis kunsanensis]
MLVLLERAAARHQPQLGAAPGGPVDLAGGEVVLVVLLHAVDLEHRIDAVGAGDRDLVTGLQLRETEEDRRPGR